MRFQIAALRANIAKAISDALAWEEGKKAQRVENWERNQAIARNEQEKYASAAAEIAEVIHDAVGDNKIVTSKEISEIWERYGVIPEVKRYDSGIPEKVQTREEVEAEVTPHTAATLDQLDHLTKILDLTTDEYVSTNALQQAGYRGHIPLG